MIRSKEERDGEISALKEAIIEIKAKKNEEIEQVRKDKDAEIKEVKDEMRQVKAEKDKFIDQLLKEIEMLKVINSNSKKFSIPIRLTSHDANLYKRSDHHFA